MLGKRPNHPDITEMDFVEKMWMFENWLEDRKDKVELTKNHAYLLGSFWNPEAVNRLMNKDNNKYESSDEGFKESLRMVDESIKEDNKTIKRRKKKRVFKR